MIADEMMVSGRKDFLIVILKEKMNMTRLPSVIQTYLSKFQAIPHFPGMQYDLLFLNFN